MQRQLVRKQGGFTLVEILVSIAVFAIGGVAILALFIAMVDRSRQAIDITRATEIARNVRASLEASVKLPAKRRSDRYYRQLSFPFATLTRDLAQRTEMANSPTYEDDPQTYYYQLPTESYKGPENQEDDSYAVIPKELYELDFEEVTVDGRPPEVFYVLPSAFRSVRQALGSDSEKETFDDLVDQDRSEAYSFSFFIRRSVQRSEQDDDSGNKKALAPGLFVVHLRIFKGDLSRPIVEERFTLYAENLADLASSR